MIGRRARPYLATTRRLIGGLVLLGGVMMFGCSSPSPVTKNEPVQPPETAPAPEVVSTSADLDYSRFGHTNPSHSTLPCLLCHRRDDDASQIRFPGKPDHLPCAGCHMAQFSDPASTMCTICHTNAGTGEMKNFPRLVSFNSKFDHARHTRETNCATCHTPNRGGAGFSMPSGTGAHMTCFQCHTADKPIGSCSTCHAPGRPSTASDWAKAYTVGFSHREHSTKTNCTSCHNVMAGSARGRQVSSPIAAMHSANVRSNSCAGCHNGKRAFGANDFTNCKRCHEGKSFGF